MKHSGSFRAFLTLRSMFAAIITAAAFPLATTAQGNIVLTGHDTLLHSGQDGYDLVMLDYLRDGSEAAATYTIGVIGSNAGFWRFSSGTSAPVGYPIATYYDTNDLDGNGALQDAAVANDLLIINAHVSCGGCDLTTEGSAVINTQMTGKILARFNQGMDLWVETGANLATYYDFLPSSFVATAAPISGSTFCATTAGEAEGVLTDHTTGHQTHNRFPTYSPLLTVWETNCPAPGTDVITLAAKDIVIPDDCPTNDVILNTGYDHPAGGGVIAINAIDPRWTVVEDPFAGTIEPRPATVITKYDSWVVPDAESQWISGYPSAVQNVNGNYVFETKFCIRDGADLSLATLEIGMRGDDACFASLNGGAEFHTGDAFTDPSLTISTYTLDVINGVVGENTLRIRVQNIFNIAMGLDLVASVHASPDLTAERPECCLPSGALQGRVFARIVTLEGVVHIPRAGWTVNMTGSLDPRVRQTTTDAGGFYNFTDLPPDTYTITQTPPWGWVQVFPAGHRVVTLSENQGLNQLDFVSRRRGWREISNPVPRQRNL